MAASQLYDSEDEEFVDAYDPEEMKQIREISEKEIKEIALDIGHEWKDLGLQMGFKNGQLQHLEQVYPNQPYWRNIAMIAEWCGVVSNLHFHVRMHLANILYIIGRSDRADNLFTDYKVTDDKEKKRIYQDVQCVSFDKPIFYTLQKYDIESLKIENCPSRPHQVQYIIDIIENYGVTIATRRIEPTTSLEKIPLRKEKLPQWLFNETEKSPNVSLSLKNQYMKDMIKDLSLESFFPAKISIVDVRTIRSFDDTLIERNLPWLLLSKIFMLNNTAREKDLNNLYEQRQTYTGADSDDHQFENTTVHSIHPCDLLYLTFLCCDPILKLEVISKLFTCRLAIPFIYRDFNDKLMLSQWALRKIIIYEETVDGSPQLDALNHDTNIISFVRLGDQSISKSRIINEMLASGNHHIFFNRDCLLGSSKRKIANGIVEGSWFIPSRSESDLFNELTFFLNLRGCCMRFRSELEKVCKLSCAIVVHISVKQLLQNAEIRVLTEIHRHNIPVVYALESNMDSKNSQEIWKEYKCSMSKYEKNIRLVNLKSQQLRSSSDITNFFRHVLNKLLNDKRSKPVPLLEKTKRLGISDESIIPECTKSKKLADQILSTVSENLCSIKTKVLSLQGEAWSEWCSAVKRQLKAKSDDEIENSESVKIRSRNIQITELLERLHQFMKNFLKVVISKDTNLFYVLTWMNFVLDEQCRKTLPQLICEYRKHKMSMRALLERHDKNLLQLKEEVNTTEQKLLQATFGIEHLIRELGQIYESISVSKNHVGTFIEYLPCVVSRLIQQGQPIEIVDGDNNIIPVIWIKACLTQLAKDIGDKKILTISVLGIQSSGKSTLLNAMFGLQFSVSAGRCTRGVFAQLIEVKDTTLPYDFVLVLDTEGLKAPEFSGEHQSHDNELATLVLGLGNITLINIKGESTSEIGDILQIAVHAFLRLKMANERLKLHQRCIFVHQNVPAEDAATKMTYARQKMMDQLDKCAIYAAKQEGISNIYAFNQVLQINIEQDIWYFPGLYSGDLPMATINKGYCRKVIEVRHRILYDLGKTKQLLTIPETLSQIVDLWTGIQSDNFVFNFRNSLEVKAHHEMETTYHNIVWTLEKDVSRYIQYELRRDYSKCANENELEETSKQLIEKLNSFVDDLISKGENSFNSFITSSPLINIMEQWHENRIILLKETIEELRVDGTKTLTHIKTQTAAEIMSRKRRKEHEIELKKLAHELAEKCKGIPLSEIQLQETFDEMWIKQINSFEQEEPVDSKTVKEQVKDRLFKLFKADEGLLLQETKKQQDSRISRRPSMLYRSLSNTDINKGHISLCLGQSNNENIPMIIHSRMAVKLADKIFEELDHDLHKLSNGDTPFNKSHASEVFKKLKDYLEVNNAKATQKTNDNATQFTTTTLFRAKLAVHVANYITLFFEEMDAKYKKHHNVLEQIKTYKVSIFQFFKDEFENKRREQIQSNLLGNSLELIVRHEIERVLPQEVVRIILTKCFNTKYNLLKEMLTDLAMKEEFTKYVDYLDHDKKYALEWITEFTNQYLFNGDSNRYNEVVEHLIETHFDMIDECMSTSLRQHLHDNVLDWITSFRDLLSRKMHIGVELSCIDDAYLHIDMVNVKENVLGNLRGVHENLRKTFLIIDYSSSITLEQSIYHTILDKLWGCKEKCPFCGETCVNTSATHPQENHRCLQHRPKGVIGETFNPHKGLDWFSCSLFFYHSSYFNCSQVGFRCKQLRKCAPDFNQIIEHRIADFPKMIPGWDIEPCPAIDMPKYWMWFMYTFRYQLFKKFERYIPREILKWKTISKEEAISSLRHQ